MNPAVRTTVPSEFGVNPHGFTCILRTAPPRPVVQEPSITRTAMIAVFLLMAVVVTGVVCYKCLKNWQKSNQGLPLVRPLTASDIKKDGKKIT